MMRGSEVFATRLCTGRMAAQKGLQDLVEDQSEEAQEGTLIHEAHRDPAKAALLNASQISVLESQVHAREELLGQIFAGVDIPSLRVIREEEFYVSIDGNPLVSCHPDYIAIGTVGGKRIGVIVDYKSGWLSNEVPPPEINDQLRAYAVAVAQLYAVDEMIVTIIPRFGKAMQPAAYDANDINRALADLADVDRAARENSGVRTPSLDACKYCRAKATDRCPETLKLPATFNQPLNLATLGPEQWSVLLDQCAMADDRMKAIKEKAKAMLTADPASIPGYALKPGALMPAVADPDAVYAKVQDVIEPEAFGRDCCDVSVTKLRKVYGTASGIKVKDQKDELDRILGNLITYTPKSHSLVRTAGKQIKDKENA